MVALGQGPRTVDSLARQLDVKKERVSRHARALEAIGLVRATERQPRTYELVREPVVWEQAWAELSIPARRAMLAASLARTHVSASAAVDTGGFDAPDSYLTRTTVRVREEQWREIASELGDLLRRLGAIEDDPAGTPATVVTMLFAEEEQGARDDAEEPPSGDDAEPPHFGDDEARLEAYGVVEEAAALMSAFDAVPWTKVAALAERLRLVSLAAASLEETERREAAAASVRARTVSPR